MRRRHTMKKRMICVLSIISLLFSFSFSTYAATDSVVSSISVSAGGTGYSDTNSSPTSLYVPYGQYGSSVHYTRYYVQLHTFKFDSYPQDIKPASNVRFNLRPVTKNTHYSSADVAHIYSAYASTTAAMSSGYGYSGQSFAMKSNITNWSATNCVFSCIWYLYNP